VVLQTSNRVRGQDTQREGKFRNPAVAAMMRAGLEAVLAGVDL